MVCISYNVLDILDQISACFHKLTVSALCEIKLIFLLHLILHLNTTHFIFIIKIHFCLLYLRGIYENLFFMWTLEKFANWNTMTILQHDLRLKHSKPVSMNFFKASADNKISDFANKLWYLAYVFNLKIYQTFNTIYALIEIKKFFD